MRPVSNKIMRYCSCFPRNKDLERENNDLKKALTIYQTQVKDLQIERNNLLTLVEKALEQKTTQITWSRNTVTSSKLDSSVQAIDESSSISVRISELETVNLQLTEKLSTMKNILRKSIELVMEEDDPKSVYSAPQLRKPNFYLHTLIVTNSISAPSIKRIKKYSFYLVISK